MSSRLEPAAQYLRMSTEHQQYSLANQSAAIQRYAQTNNFDVIRTYSDPATSGLNFKKRKGLQNLLRDVVAGEASFRTILVYDVSRWGRFQDLDEAAHYEFTCRSAGIAVRYCAEDFAYGDSSPLAQVLKTLKRALAAEYSRELSTRVYAAQKYLSEHGFNAGGIAGYGLRRAAIFPDGRLEPLENGERSAVAGSHVILVPGPAHEVSCVQEIFRLYTEKRWSTEEIMRDLNRRGIPSARGRLWTSSTVWTILRNPKYAGMTAYGKTTQKMGIRRVKLPREQWISVPAFEPIVDRATFEEAQRLLGKRGYDDEELLEALRDLLERHGELTSRLIHQEVDVPPFSTFVRRFGNFAHACAMIGYKTETQSTQLQTRRRVDVLRRELMAQIVSANPAVVSICRGQHRPYLYYDNQLIPVILCRLDFVNQRGVETWAVNLPFEKTETPAVLCLLSKQSDRIQHLFLIDDLKACSSHLRLADLLSRKARAFTPSSLIPVLCH